MRPTIEAALAATGVRQDAARTPAIAIVFRCFDMDRLPLLMLRDDALRPRAMARYGAKPRGLQTIFNYL
jgi:hypothetical protein